MTAETNPTAAPPGMKRCGGCGRTLPVTSFHVRKRSPDGRQSWCKACVATYQSGRDMADHRRRQAAYHRALARLRDRYPKVFRQLYREELRAEGLEP